MGSEIPTTWRREKAPAMHVCMYVCKENVFPVCQASWMMKHFLCAVNEGDAIKEFLEWPRHRRIEFGGDLHWTVGPERLTDIPGSFLFL